MLKGQCHEVFYFGVNGLTSVSHTRGLIIFSLNVTLQTLKYEISDKIFLAAASTVASKIKSSTAVASVRKPSSSYCKNSYLCTFDLYGPVRNAFDAGRIKSITHVRIPEQLRKEINSAI
jgi:hypothetical protein